ncbi:hypothetical protein BKA00_005828 [Actinomadura coerulea]|uniref:Uncharacterized protein n=1 Tax=Actinomadura coerulea TaxID=46159 RepID=A0A7X0L263_9ACTN|nr:hypothetical protein [Actinomadura coerulea]MBB6398914.1 hypothetical protein [Actinomadura coerulea]GGP98290.1 hypothetical protein GCM10010187_12380 [Actinomadura coerulea]
MTATHHQQAHQHLYVLGQQVRAYDSVAADLRDGVLHVALLTGGRVEQVRCAPRPDDGGRLWLWDSHRRPLAEAGHPDAALAVVRRLR